MSRPDSTAEVVAQALRDLMLGSDPLEDEAVWPVFYGYLPDGPDECICVADTTGVLDGREMRAGTIVHPGVQIRFRSKPGQDNLKVGGAKVTQVEDALDAVARLDVELTDADTLETRTYVIQAFSRAGDRIHLPPDQDARRRYGFTLNYTLTIDETTPAGTGS